ncbi:uncharacterized protein F5891DRAFT_985459 [Suillus fuscotomentosus]|uniref:Uncharacterized protein n=1 Tax=Suillus fuscotomentosus TaxID=1912939 RepID=A0AAD4DU96_9AGAM|nr:uncharacterized protein F5891DRAFT_985459 [Suillus fuscotomentosus]KAG1893919.1 hypothetical protein F5891DRAFT_985459 [Suillus fuscotomentosus]
MGRPQLYNSSEEKARAAHKYRQTYKERNTKSINQQLFAVISNSSREFTETLCCALIQSLDIIKDLELEARKVGSAVLTRVREVRVSLQDIIAWVRIDMDALDEAYEKGEIYHQYANSIYVSQKLLSLSGSRIWALRLWIRDGPYTVCTIIMLHPTTHQTEQAKLAEVQEIQRALAVALGYDDEDPSELETSDDENDALLLDLPSWLLAVKSIKDEMLVLIGEPCTFTQNLLSQYVKSLPDEVLGKGDTSIIQNYFLDIEGLTELMVAHSMGELMYQKDIHI